MPTRIVKATRSDTDYLGHCGEPAKQWRAALRAKATAHGIATVRPYRVKAWFAFSNSKRCRRHPHDGCVRGPCSPLAIAAMAVQRQNRSGGTFIADSTAGASACEAGRHRSYLRGPFTNHSDAVEAPSERAKTIGGRLARRESRRGRSGQIIRGRGRRGP